MKEKGIFKYNDDMRFYLFNHDMDYKTRNERKNWINAEIGDESV